MNDKKDLDDLENIFKAGDGWLTKYGIVSPVMHNNIVLNLYVNFPKVHYFEYFMDPDKRKIEVIGHLSFWRLLLTNKDKLIDSIFDLLKEYLHEYDVTVRLKRYKKGIEKSGSL